MAVNYQGVKFIIQNWKLIIHLLFKTNRFGVNNQWSSNFDSIFGGWTVGQRIINTIKIKPIIFNYQFAKYRAVSCGFLSRESCEALGWRLV